MKSLPFHSACGLRGKNALTDGLHRETFSGMYMLAMAWSIVDFPLPFGPKIAVNA